MRTGGADDSLSERLEYPLVSGEFGHVRVANPAEGGSKLGTLLLPARDALRGPRQWTSANPVVVQQALTRAVLARLI
jgi:hypothetical protein